MSILDVIADATRERVSACKERVSSEQLASQARALAEAELAANGQVGIVDTSGQPCFAFPFLAALQQPGLSFICEAKKASPSKGIIAADFPYIQIARDYEAAGAAAISCLTEPRWFMGADRYLSEIVQEVNIPVLRKDFVVDEYMVYQAKVLGASAVLLICSILDDKQLEHYGALAESLGMSVLVEAHDEQELARALASGARIVGVNNRNLGDFSVDFGNAARLREAVPPDVVFVAESGVRTVRDVQAIARMGADAALVGEALMRADDKAAALGSFKQAAAMLEQDAALERDAAFERDDTLERNIALKQVATGAPVKEVTPEKDAGLEQDAAHLPKKHAPAVKFCGLSQPDDLAAINQIAPDYVGFVFWSQSKRAVSFREARALRAMLDPGIATVGVFVDASVNEIAQLYHSGVISVAQLHGHEDNAFINRLCKEAPGLAVWKAFEVGGAKALRAAEASAADLVLLDAGKGCGQAFDWQILSGISRPFALAGGLDAAGVAAARAAGLEPVLFDVSSGIEAPIRAADGRPRKDAQLMAEFVHEVRKSQPGLLAGGAGGKENR